jgi:hypothetical protein
MICLIAAPHRRPPASRHFSYTARHQKGSHGVAAFHHVASPGVENPQIVLRPSSLSDGAALTILAHDEIWSKAVMTLPAVHRR